MRYLITGSAGFIGSHLAKRLLCDGHSVDGLTPYYDQNLTCARHRALAQFAAFTATETMLENAGQLTDCVASAKADIVTHLAAQAIRCADFAESASRRQDIATSRDTMLPAFPP